MYVHLSSTAFLCGFSKHLLLAVPLAQWGGCKEENCLYYLFLLEYL